MKIHIKLIEVERRKFHTGGIAFILSIPDDRNYEGETILCFVHVIHCSADIHVCSLHIYFSNKIIQIKYTDRLNK